MAVVGVDMEKLNAETDRTLRRIKAYATREELKMGDDLGDSGTLPTTIPDLLQRVLQKLGTWERLVFVEPVSLVVQYRCD